jgi:hypothetical protein
MLNACMLSCDLTVPTYFHVLSLCFHFSISLFEMTNEGSLVVSIRYDNHSYSDVETKLLRYSPHHSPKANTFARGKTRRSMDVSMGQGPDFEKVT